MPTVTKKEKATKKVKAGRIVELTYGQEIKLSREYNSAGFQISATAEIGEGDGPKATMKKLKQFVGENAKAELNDVLGFLNQVASQ